MIKVEVTQLKAPWPSGAGVGSVVLLAVPLLPAWAAGKCIVLPADDEREPVGTWEPPSIQSDRETFAPSDGVSLVVNPAGAADQLAEHAARIAELGQQLQDSQQALGTARAEIQSLTAERDAAVHRAADVAVALDGASRERDAALADLQALRDAGAAKATKKGAG